MVYGNFSRIGGPILGCLNEASYCFGSILGAHDSWKLPLGQDELLSEGVHCSKALNSWSKHSGVNAAAVWFNCRTSGVVEAASSAVRCGLPAYGFRTLNALSPKPCWEPAPGNQPRSTLRLQWKGWLSCESPAAAHVQHGYHKVRRAECAVMDDAVFVPLGSWRPETGTGALFSEAYIVPIITSSVKLPSINPKPR